MASKKIVVQASEVLGGVGVVIDVRPQTNHKVVVRLNSKQNYLTSAACRHKNLASEDSRRPLTEILHESIDFQNFSKSYILCSVRL